MAESVQNNGGSGGNPGGNFDIKSAADSQAASQRFQLQIMELNRLQTEFKVYIDFLFAGSNAVSRTSDGIRGR